MVLFPTPRSRIAQLSMASPLKGRSGLLERKLLGLLIWWIFPQFLQRDLLPFFRVKANKGMRSNWMSQKLLALSLCLFLRDMCLVTKSCPIFETPWTAARQAPQSMGFPRQECWSGLPFPFPGDLPWERSNLCLPHSRLILYHWATRKATSPLCYGINIFIMQRTQLKLREVERIC